jgi:hypothetical protein
MGPPCRHWRVVRGISMLRRGQVEELRRERRGQQRCSAERAEGASQAAAAAAATTGAELSRLREANRKLQQKLSGLRASQCAAVETMTQREAAAAAAAAGGRAVDGLQDGRQACARRPAEGLAWSQRLAAERSRAERARLALTEQVRTHCR